ncbi:MAG: methyltransferase domain-containing protein [Firmicutes bacterium]|nr:methyltransferase domain-containing protein [Bacillota bacterium]
MTGTLYNKDFPRSNKYDFQWIHDNQMGPHPLWMTEFLAQSMDLKPGMRVLDLGSGKGMTSVFLANEFNVRVCAVDFDEWEGWTSPESRWGNAKKFAVEHLVTPIKADARNLPFAKGYFDVIICVNAYFYFGAETGYLEYLLQFLRPGGQVGIIIPGYTRDISGGKPEYMSMFDDGSCTWQTLPWWKSLWDGSGLVDIKHADYLPDGCSLWARWDKVLLGEAKTQQDMESHKADIEILERDNGEYIGFIRMVATKKDLRLRGL